MWTRLSSLFFQNRCIFCQESAPAERDLCEYCVKELPLIAGACKRCALPLSEQSSNDKRVRVQICRWCRRKPPPIRFTLACSAYTYPADYLVQRLKFAAELKYARVMGVLLAETVLLQGGDDIDLVVPVPLSRQRFAQRGFNQAEEIARYTAGTLDRKLNRHSLLRDRDCVPQMGLSSRLRKRNVQGVFSCRPDVSGQRCALVDDVMTTGATVKEAALTLLQAGAVSVDVWAFARTV